MQLGPLLRVRPIDEFCVPESAQLVVTNLDEASRSEQSEIRPDFEDGLLALRLVDLFCGCGGLTLGAAQAARASGVAIEIALALDMDVHALAVYRKNFANANTSDQAAESVFDGVLGDPASKKESVLATQLGPVHAIVGGPPCQGHSNLNNVSRRIDPKNELYLRMVRAAEILSPLALLIENVPAVERSKVPVVKLASSHLAALGYSVATAVIHLVDIGVPQTRKRHLLLATKRPIRAASQIMDVIAAQERQRRSVRDAIWDLKGLPNEPGWNAWPKASSANVDRMKWLIDNQRYDLPNELRPACHQNEDHSYKSMYGRLHWDEPAQTLTTGFTSIGQGRYMHPELPRALTNHEAARLQGFPDYFDFSEVTRRTALATMIGNAVPPALAELVFDNILLDLPASELAGDPG